MFFYHEKIRIKSCQPGFQWWEQICHESYCYCNGPLVNLSRWKGLLKLPLDTIPFLWPMTELVFYLQIVGHQKYPYGNLIQVDSKLLRAP